MLSFNEGKVCDAVVRHLEERAGASRANLRWPEDEGHPHPVEIAFMINGNLFALEHTGIEPFKGHVQMDAGWVRATAPTVPARRYADYRKTSVGPATVPGVPFPVSLYRFEPALVPGHHFQLTHLVKNGDQQRKDRIREAVERKFPKLAAWKRDANARTILVLEDNDIQLTNQAIVTETYLPLAMGRADRPDETYLVASCIDPWHAWPILIGDKSYFNFAQAGDAQDWQIDPARLVPLTKR